jgi:hypothetical protein
MQDFFGNSPARLLLVGRLIQKFEHDIRRKDINCNGMPFVRAHHSPVVFDLYATETLTRKLPPIKPKLHAAYYQPNFLS